MEEQQNAATQAELAKLNVMDTEVLTSMLQVASQSVARLDKQSSESIEAAKIQMQVLADARTRAESCIRQAEHYTRLLTLRTQTVRLIQRILEQRWSNGSPYPRV